MNIKSLLIGSAAALAAVSGAQAADAIVAAEPEPLEYVRVCDAFGTGFFYIPGTETCLKIGGYVRFQTEFGRDLVGSSDWDSWTRARVTFDAKSDTELGTLTSFIAIHGESSRGFPGGATNSLTYDANGSLIDHTDGFYVEEAYIELGGFRVGTFLNWWDDDLIGETEIASTTTRFTSARYVYDAGTFRAGLSVDEIESTKPNGVGISGMLGAVLGGVSFELLGAYDTELEEGAVRAWLSAEVGPGTFELAGWYASGPNVYFEEAEWSIAVDYAFQATEKLRITPGFQYFSDRHLINGNDAWTGGLTVDYTVVENLALKATVNYYDEDIAGDSVTGFLRLQRNF
ncbi:porin [Shinella sp. BYT-45]|uniref:porin n=1 Tax=Shinella sp. BYT-45 TaxID=3377377 RepID=UPI0039812EC5